MSRVEMTSKINNCEMSKISSEESMLTENISLWFVMESTWNVRTSSESPTSWL